MMEKAYEWAQKIGGWLLIAELAIYALNSHSAGHLLSIHEFLAVVERLAGR
ncbi:MAG: hypothetical protein WA324_29120 [Bryobacteraceae bacterium]